MNRLFFEYHAHSTGAFVTLTYNDDNLPFAVDEETGLCIPTLVKKDLQLFMKRLRKLTGNGLRFFAVGEYGSTTARPHYHLLLFGYPYKFSIGKAISDSWKKGFVSVGSITGASINYVTKYVLIGGVDPEFFDLLDRFDAQRPFMFCSRRPFIGYDYLTDDMIDYHRKTGSLLLTRDGYKQPLPRIYRGKIFNEFTLRKLNEQMRQYAVLKSDKQWRDQVRKYGLKRACLLRDQRIEDCIRKIEKKLKHNQTI